MEQSVEDLCSVPRGGVEKKKRERKNRSRTVRAVCRGLLLCATRWRKKKKKKIGRGPIEQRVGDFCSVPRDGVGKKGKMGNRSRSDRAVGRGLLLCAKGRRGKKTNKKNKTKGKHEICGRGPIGRCVEKFCPVPRGGVERKTKNRSGTTCAMSFLFALCRVVA